MLGIPVGPPRQPVSPLTEPDKAELAEILDRVIEAERELLTSDF